MTGDARQSASAEPQGPDRETEAAWSWHARTVAGTELGAREPRSRHYAASTMKLAVLVAVARALDARAAEESTWVPVSGTWTSVLDGRGFEVDEEDRDHDLLSRGGADVAGLAERMITVSSNDATNALLELVGMDAVQRAMRDVGAVDGTVRRPINDLAARDAGITNDVSARDLTHLATAVAAGRAASAQRCGWMLRLLLAQQHRDCLPDAFPPHVLVGAKQGCTRDVLHDVAVVFPPAHEPVALAVCTSGMDHEAARRLMHRLVADLSPALRL